MCNSDVKRLFCAPGIEICPFFCTRFLLFEKKEQISAVVCFVCSLMTWPRLITLFSEGIISLEYTLRRRSFHCPNFKGSWTNLRNGLQDLHTHKLTEEFYYTNRSVHSFQHGFCLLNRASSIWTCHIRTQKCFHCKYNMYMPASMRAAMYMCIWCWRVDARPFLHIMAPFSSPKGMNLPVFRHMKYMDLYFVSVWTKVLPYPYKERSA